MINFHQFIFFLDFILFLIKKIEKSIFLMKNQKPKSQLLKKLNLKSWLINSHKIIICLDFILFLIKIIEKVIVNGKNKKKSKKNNHKYSKSQSYKMID